LEQRSWDKLSPRQKFRLKANLGATKLAAGKSEEAGRRSHANRRARSAMSDIGLSLFYSFAAASVGFLALFLYRLPHLHSTSMIRLLVGPLFEFTLAAVSGIAAWTVWKAHPSARGWAIAASLLYLSISIRPFLIPMRPVRDHYLVSLVLGLVGLAAFSWPDRIAKLSDTRESS
jgi:hypothetical protein